MDIAYNGTSNSESMEQAGRPAKRQRISAQPTREVGLMRSIPGDKFPGFVGSASGIYFIQSVYRAVGRLQSSNPHSVETPASEIVPGEDDHLPTVVPTASAQLWTAGEVIAGSELRFTVQELLEWSASYFVNWHPFYPFLHAPAVVEYFERVSRDGTSQLDEYKDFQNVIFRSIMSISLADRRQAKDLDGMRYPKEIVFSSFDAAVDSLQDILSHPTTMQGLQAAISVQLFLVSMLRLNAASRLGGLINRMTLQLGLHRCPARYSAFTSNEKAIRQRIFWSVFAIDRFICQSMGLPLGIHDHDVDVCFPNNELHGNRLQQPPPDNKLRWHSFIARQCKLRGEIIELRNKSLHYVHKDPEEATAITARLTELWNDVQEYSDVDHGHSLSEYHLTVMTLLKHESNISLYRPILAAAKRGANYDAALQLCIGSARSIITMLHKASSPGQRFISDQRRQILMWPSTTWAVWISTFILFYAANNGHLSRDMVMRLTDRSLEILQHLSQRGSAWPETSAAAIKDLRKRMMTPLKGDVADDDPTLQHSSEPASSTLNPAPTGTFQPNSQDQPEIQQDAGYGLPGTIHGQSQSLGGIFGSSDNAAARQTITPHLLYDDRYFLSTTGTNPSAPGIETNFINIQEPSASSSSMAMMGNMDPFSGFDIPFWLGQDQQWNTLPDLNYQI